jgi:radical SAM family uncharacterized protein/radical SAM-linked protein
MSHPYASFVHLVQKPARYLGGEHGAIKKDWSSVRARVCLAFPDIYDIGMSHLGFKILYKILNDDPRTLAERCYVPWVDMQKELIARELPLVSLETARTLREFDVVGFSLQFELTYTNVLTMLDLGKIPLLSADRGEDDPLVIAGGPTATHPEPIAMFIDAIVIGDGEEATTDIALLWTDLKSKGVPRAQRLAEIAKHKGVYVPSLYTTTLDADTGFEVVTSPKHDDLALPIRRNLVDDLNAFPFPDDGPVGGPEAIFDRMSIEIARGCTEGCRFCQAGMIYRPVRERDPEQIVNTVVSAVKKSGYDEVSLTSLSTADYSCIAPLIQKVTEKLAPERVSLGVSSLRAYGLEEPVLDDIARVRASGITFAPEAGSQRMRDVVNKNVTEEQLMTTAERIFSRGYKSMKLYFMIGLPTEEEEDVREIVRVGARARDIGKRLKKEMNAQPPTVTVSVSTHVPKPHTPFQWCAMDRHAVVQEKQSWLTEEAKISRIELRMHDSSGSWLEGVFARGDRKVGLALLAAYRLGARFDSWEDQLNIGIWEKAFDEVGVDIARYLGTIPLSARLPWSHIDVGLEEGFLASEYKKALKSRLSPPCGKVAGAFIHHTNLADAERDTKKLVCYDCGVACDLSAMRAERKDYLIKLGARERRIIVPKVVVHETGKKKPPRIVQGDPIRYRFGYTKCGPSAFLAHLDLIRALPRSFRRVDLPLFYSSGFHPKPDMTFGPALSLGVHSVGEMVDVKMVCDVDPNEFVAKLTECSPDGLRFFAVKLGHNDAAVSRIIDAQRYAVAIPNKSIASRGGIEWLKERVSQVLASESLPVVRRIDGIGKRIEVRSFLKALEVQSDAAARAIDEAQITGDLCALMVLVSVSHSGGVKISEVMEVIDPALDFVAVRMEMGRTNEQGTLISPLDTATLRAMRATPNFVESEPEQAAP